MPNFKTIKGFQYSLLRTSCLHCQTPLQTNHQIQLIEIIISWKFRVISSDIHHIYKMRFELTLSVATIDYDTALTCKFDCGWHSVQSDKPYNKRNFLTQQVIFLNLQPKIKSDLLFLFYPWMLPG